LTLASKSNLTDPNPGPVTIVSQPRSLTVNEGDAARFSVGAAGASPLFYQWRLNGDDISGATAARLSFEHASRSDAGDYTVVVSNDSGSVTSQVATLTVVRPRVLALGGNI